MEHDVPKGPLAVRWTGHEFPAAQAGTLAIAKVRLENAGSATWRPDRVKASYHWLDERGNPLVWDGLRTELPGPVTPGTALTLLIRVRAPIPPGAYRIAFDLVDEERFWLAELGNHTPEFAIQVARRDTDGARVFYPPGAEPAPASAELIRLAHEEGFAAVGGSIDTGRRRNAPLEPYAPGGGRKPAFAHPLVCPSLIAPLEPNERVEGLPAWRPEADEPWLYDGRLELRLRPRSGRRPV